MIHDQHVHTSYSRDSKASIDEYYEIASEMGCHYFVATDHLEFMSSYNHQDWTVDYENLNKDLERLGKKYPMVRPLKGVEIGYRRDHLGRMLEAIKTGDYDLINLSVHDNGEIDYYMIEEFKKRDYLKTLIVYFNNVIEAIETIDDFDVLSHFDYGFKTAHCIDESLKISDYQEYLIKIFSLLIKKQKALEINIKVQETINDPYHVAYFLQLYKSLGGKRITISTNSHFTNLYLVNFDKYAKMAKDAGFNELCYYVRRKEYRYSL